MKLRKSSGGVVLNKNGLVLIVSKGHSWSLPKGHIEKGESELEAAKREIYEESGIKNLTLVKSLGSYQRYGIFKRNVLKTIYLFLFTTDQRELKPIDSHNPKAKWVNIKEAAKILTHQKDKEFFLSIIKLLPIDKINED